jgi:hypothetical protein
VVSYKTAVRAIIWTVIIIFAVLLILRAKEYLVVVLGGLGGAGALLVGTRAREEKELKERTDNLKDRVNKRRSGPLLILCVLGLLFCRPAAALYIPDDYETLKEYYIEADQDLTEALEIIDEYEALYQKTIEEYKRAKWCLVAGAYVDESAHLKLGVGKKQDNYLVSVGGVYQDSFGVYCEAVVWIQSPF